MSDLLNANASNTAKPETTRKGANHHRGHYQSGLGGMPDMTSAIRIRVAVVTPGGSAVGAKKPASAISRSGSRGAVWITLLRM